MMGQKTDKKGNGMEAKELIQINYDANDNPTVLGRDLHDVLKIKTAYKDWFPRMCEYGFEEGQDFCSFLSESTGGRPATDHQLTIDMAKQICMIQRSEEGRRYREYFLEIEKKWNSPEAVMARALQMANRQIDALKNDNAALIEENEKKEQRLALAAPKVQVYDTLAAIDKTFTLSDTCKEINCGMGSHTFVKQLVTDGFLYRTGNGRNKGELRPIQKWVDAGLFIIREGYDSMTLHPFVQVRVTFKGREYLFKKYGKERVL